VEEGRVLNGMAGWRKPRDEGGAALIVVLLAIVVLLPLTLVLAKFALEWQRQSLDYRDTISEEFGAHAGFEHARDRIAANGLELEPDQGRSFVVEELAELGIRVRVSREADVVVSHTGSVLDKASAQSADLELTGVDAEGRVVYQFRKLEIYVVRVDVSRRPTLAAVRLYGIVAKLPDDTVEILGSRLSRGYFD
jgi:hypothetical protein